VPYVTEATRQMNNTHIQYRSRNFAGGDNFIGGDNVIAPENRSNDRN